MRQMRLMMMAFGLMLTAGATAQSTDDTQRADGTLKKSMRPNGGFGGGMPGGGMGGPGGAGGFGGGMQGGPRGGMPPGGFGGHGSRQKDIKYSGATSLTTAATETGKAYESTKTDESALMISTKGAVTVSQPTISKTGDSDGGNSHFTMNGGSLTSKQGHLFHVTNTNAIITLNGVTPKNEDAANVLLSVCADIKTNGHRLFVDGKEMKM